ncbi:MAG TPA: hypothetical protein VLU96_06245 [Gaiellaceae bacterium]|nr:hypothetical protein [Gaiellaceae bacterium]
MSIVPPFPPAAVVEVVPELLLLEPPHPAAITVKAIAATEREIARFTGPSPWIELRLRLVIRTLGERQMLAARNAPARQLSVVEARYAATV